MKVKDLLSILQSVNPNAEINVSTVRYFEKNRYESELRRGEYQSVNSVTVDAGKNIVAIDGGVRYGD